MTTTAVKVELTEVYVASTGGGMSRWQGIGYFRSEQEAKRECARQRDPNYWHVEAFPAVIMPDGTYRLVGSKIKLGYPTCSLHSASDDY